MNGGGDGRNYPSIPLPQLDNPVPYPSFHHPPGWLWREGVRKQKGKSLPGKLIRVHFLFSRLSPSNAIRPMANLKESGIESHQKGHGQGKFWCIRGGPFLSFITIQGTIDSRRKGALLERARSSSYSLHSEAWTLSIVSLGLVYYSKYPARVGTFLLQLYENLCLSDWATRFRPTTTDDENGKGPVEPTGSEQTRTQLFHPRLPPELQQEKRRKSHNPTIQPYASLTFLRLTYYIVYRTESPCSDYSTLDCHCHYLDK